MYYTPTYSLLQLDDDIGVVTRCPVFQAPALLDSLLGHEFLEFAQYIAAVEHEPVMK